MVRENPDLKAYMSNIGDRLFLVIVHPELIREFSLAFQDYKKFKMFKHQELNYDRGLFFAHGDDWRVQRDFIGPAFTHERLQNAIPIMRAVAKDTIT
jgi:cytochrome P450